MEVYGKYTYVTVTHSFKWMFWVVLTGYEGGSSLRLVLALLRKTLVCISKVGRRAH